VRLKDRKCIVAGAIFFFTSDDSSLCQGSVLSIDGGFTAQ